MIQAWRLLRPEGFSSRGYGSEFAIYDDFSGVTRVVGLAAGEILLALQGSPKAQTKEELIRRLNLGDDISDQELTKLTDILSELEGIELIEAVTI